MRAGSESAFRRKPGFLDGIEKYRGDTDIAENGRTRHARFAE